MIAGSRLVLLLCLASCAHTAGSSGPAVDVYSHPFVDLQGAPATLDAQRGKVVLLDFWASWCVPCRETFPQYAQLHRELEAKGFAVVAVSIDEDLSAARAFLEKQDVPFFTVNDPSGAFAQRLGVSVLPTAFLIDRRGALVVRQEGFAAEEIDTLRRRAEGLLEAR